MLKSLKKSKNEGFTIIEVMIVLAIVGLIMLIVFLAVPALQRNSRNTQRKNDAAAVSGALATYINNSNGKLPTNVDSATTGQVDVCNAACAGATIKETAKIGYYDTGKTFMGTAGAGATNFTAVTAIAAAYGTNVDKDSEMIVLKGSCDTTTQGRVNFNARSVAVIYVTEASGANAGTIQCVD